MRRFLVIVLLAFWPFAHVAADSRIAIHSASSLEGVLDAVFAQTEARIAYGASSAMARQGIAGAPADLYLSANVDWAEAVAGSVGRQSKPFARNSLVLVGQPLDDILDLPAKLGRARLAVAETTHVPAGIYAKEALEHLDIWDGVGPHLAEAPNVRAALTLVTRGAVPFGIVYASDAKAAGLDVRHRFDPNHHRPILYLAVPLTPAGQSALAVLLSAQAQAAFVAAGFGPL